MIKKINSNNSTYLLVIILILCSFLFPLGITPLFDLDEGAFSEATREMLEGKNFITTYLNGELRFDKPILIYWFQSISVSLFGLNEFALRLPSAISSVLWAISIFLFTKKYFNSTVALYSVIAFISSFQIALISKAAIADAMLNLYIVLTMFSVYNFYTTRENRYIYITFLFMGLGVLTKGPVAILIPFIVSFLFFTIRNEFSLWLKTIFNIRGILIFLTIAVPWYILEYIEQGELFIDGFFFQHNISRFNNSLEGHSGSYLYFIPILIFGMMPFSGILLKSFSKFKEYLKDDIKLFLIIWFLFVFIFFSFSNTKLPHYIIYGYTPLFIIIGLSLNELSHSDKSYFNLLFLSPIIFLGIFLLLPYILPHITINNEFANLIKIEFISIFDILYQAKLLIAILLLVILSLIKNISFLMKTLLISILFVLIINYLIIPSVAKVLQQPIKDIALLAKKQNLNVVMYHLNNPSFSVYREGFVRKRKPVNGDIVIMKKTYLRDFEQYTILYEDKGIVLVKILKIK